MNGSVRAQPPASPHTRGRRLGGTGGGRRRHPLPLSSVQPENPQRVSLSHRPGSAPACLQKPQALALTGADRGPDPPCCQQRGPCPVSGPSAALVAAPGGDAVPIGVGSPLSALHPRPWLFAAHQAAGCSLLWAAVLPQGPGPRPALYALALSSERRRPRQPSQVLHFENQ